MRHLVVGVIGEGEKATPQAIELARDLGKRIAGNQWAVLSGGRDAGVMRAVTEGAALVDPHLAIGILPDSHTQPSSTLDVAITTGVGEARNNINVLSSDILVACGAVGPGTASEIALALKAGKRVLLLAVDAASQSYFAALGRELIVPVSGVDEAIDAIKTFTIVPEPTPARLLGAGLTIRGAGAGDTQEWLRLRSALWPDAPASEHLAEMEDYSAPGTRAIAVVAERERGGLGGFAEASIRPYADGCSTHPVGYLEGWYVDPDLRLKGVGAALVRAAEGWAASLGCVEMGSDCLLENEIGFKAHLGIGYEEVERAIHLKRWIGREIKG